MMTRREFGLGAMGAFAFRSARAGRSANTSRSADTSRSAKASRSVIPAPLEREASAERPALAERALRGVFIILTTPFTATGEVDWQDLAGEALFCERCGVQGVVWPQGSSNVKSLSDAERLEGMRVLATATRGKRIALVLGVQGPNTREMLDYVRQAEALEPDALIAMPPTATHPVDQTADYFRALAYATRRPVIVQTSGGGDTAPSVELIVDLAREFPHVAYVKEESAPLVERMKAEIKQRPPLKGVFGASLGSGWLYEMRLGLDGVITGMGMYPDLMAAIWSMHERGDTDGVRDAYSRFLLMRNAAQQIPGADLYLFKKRGIFKTTANRTGGAAAWKIVNQQLTPDAIAEVEYRFKALAPYLKVTT
jgi:dihydrodipicolinate synthase/N-acetylneuraminate lyase